MKRLYIVFFLIVLAAVAGFGCQKKSDVIKIGVAGPMTGDQSKMGMDFKNGVSLAVEEWNSKGGLLGKKINLVIGDDQHDPKQAVSVANKMVNEGVVGVIGHFNSSCSIPASDVYDRAGLPMISPGSTTRSLRKRDIAVYTGFAGVMISRVR